MQLLPQDYEEGIIYKLNKISEIENKGPFAVVRVCYSTQKRPKFMYAINKRALLNPTLGWHVVNPKEGYKLLLSGIRGIPGRKD